MSLFRPASNRQVDVALTILRVVTGVIFLAHGGQKLFVYGLAGVSGGFAQMGIPLPGVVGPLIALLELFGGLALLFGLLTRVVSLGLAVDMLGAALLVHLRNGFFLPNGVEFVLLLLGASLALAFTGAGSFSLDALVASRRGSGAATPAPAQARSNTRRVA